jgi:hypothetical protein
MEAIVLVVVAIGAIAVIRFLLDRAKGFADPVGMTDQEVLAAIAGQAEWLERQLHHVAQFGGKEPHPELAEKRREYIVRLCETLVSRHPQPRNLMYNATKRARQLEAEGVPHKVATVQGVKQSMFEDNGYTFLARWHPIDSSQLR